MVITVRRESVDDTLARLRVYVRRFERRYECPSDEMLAKVKSRQTKETAEISRWLSAYRELTTLEKQFGHMTGSRTKAT